MEVLLKLPNSDSLQKEEVVLNFQNQSSSSSKRSLMERNDIEFRSTNSEMMEMKEENERLKAMLEEIETDYKSLKLRFSDMIHNRSDNLKNPIEIIQKLDELFDRERDLVSLSLGGGGSSSPSNGKKGDEKIGKSREKDELAMAGLTLGFGEHNHASFSLEGKKDEKEGVGSEEERLMKQRKVEKRMMGDEDGDGEEVGHQQSHVKRARVSVRARCDAPTMNDGCQWRKYGQKISKGNPCPRAYYRCTVASGCPVRKQVQRCMDDMSVLITTYEGSHNHPLPISATAMASTTAAAATMLLTGSSQSTPAAIAGTTDNRSSKFNLYSNPPFNISPATTTTTLSPLHQTVTLDLTAPSHLSSSKTTSLDFSKFSTVGSIQWSIPSTSFDFSSSAIDAAPSVWGRGNSKQSNSFPYAQLRFGPSLILEKQAIQDDQSFTETLIKTIASDPSFRSAIATAINSAKIGSRIGEEEAAAQPNTSHYLPFSVPKRS